MAETKDTSKGLGVFVNDILTPEGTLSFFNITAPDSKGKYADNKFKVELLFPKKNADGTDNKMEVLVAAVKKAAAEAWPKVDFKEIAKPWKDGDAKAETRDGYAGHWYITTKSRSKPTAIDRKAKPLDPSKFYRGCRCRLKLTALAYELPKDIEREKPDGTVEIVKRLIRGVSLKLELIQFLGDGVPLKGGGGGGASTAGMELPDEEAENPANYAASDNDPLA